MIFDEWYSPLSLLCSLLFSSGTYGNKTAVLSKSTEATRLRASKMSELLKTRHSYQTFDYLTGAADKELPETMDVTICVVVTFCILYFSSNSCSTCFGQPCAHHQELTTA
jgi:hypothetical protein